MPFTELTGQALREFVLTHSTAEIDAYWIAVQRHRRAKGEPHFTTLVDPITEHVYATI